MDKYVGTYIKTHVHVDAGGRVFCKGEELEVHVIGGVKKVVLPISKLTYTFLDLKMAGAQIDATTVKSLALAGAEGRWKDQMGARKGAGLPSNVYVANARSIEYAMEKGKDVPPVRYIGRCRKQMTEVFDTVDEVVNAMANGDWRTEFSKGGRAKRKSK